MDLFWQTCEIIDRQTQGIKQTISNQEKTLKLNILELKLQNALIHQNYVMY